MKWLVTATAHKKVNGYTLCNWQSSFYNAVTVLLYGAAFQGTKHMN